MAKMFATAQLEKPRPKRRPGVHKKNQNNRNKVKPCFGEVRGMGVARYGQALYSYWKLVLEETL